MVSILTLPINMVKMITILPASLKELVIPKLRPTVLNAEKLSNAIGNKPLSPS